MAACRADASRVSSRSAGDAAREGGIVGDDREDGPQGCVRACTAAADGMVPAGARQIDWIAGDPSAAGRAHWRQAARGSYRKPCALVQSASSTMRYTKVTTPINMRNCKIAKRHRWLVDLSVGAEGEI